MTRERSEKMEMSQHDKYAEYSYLRELETERIDMMYIMSSEDHLLKSPGEDFFYLKILSKGLVIV
jgi:hypothetical protein